MEHARAARMTFDRNSPACMAAYHVLTCRVARDSLCQLVAGLTAASMVGLREMHGMGSMLAVAQSLDASRGVAVKIRAEVPAEWLSEVSLGAVCDAVQAAARVLEKG